MRPKRITQSGAGVTNPIPLDYRRGEFELALIVDVISGSPTYTIQLTSDDVQEDGYDPATGNWFDHSYLTGLTVTDSGNLDFPATAARLSVTGTGVARLTLIHGG